MSKSSKGVLQELLKVYKTDGLGSAFLNVFERELRRVGLTTGGPPVKGSQRNGKRTSGSSFSKFNDIDHDIKE